MSQFTAVQPSNYAAIIAAIADIALLKSSLTFAGSKLYEIPLPSEIEGTGFPYLAVRWGDCAGFAREGELFPDGRVERGIGSTEPVWAFDVIAIFPHDPGAPNYDTAAKALTNLVQAFLQQYDLEGTCAMCLVTNPQMGYLRMSGAEYFSAQLTVQAFEYLAVTV